MAGEPEEFALTGRVRRIGNSLGVFLPAEFVRQAGLREGQPVSVRLRTDVPDVFGLFQDLPYTPFSREEDGLGDRV